MTYERSPLPLTQYLHFLNVRWGSNPPPPTITHTHSLPTATSPDSASPRIISLLALYRVPHQDLTRTSPGPQPFKFTFGGSFPRSFMETWGREDVPCQTDVMYRITRSGTEDWANEGCIWGVFFSGVSRPTKAVGREERGGLGMGEERGLGLGDRRCKRRRGSHWRGRMRKDGVCWWLESWESVCGEGVVIGWIGLDWMSR